jgi:hypothetical protein
VIKPTVIQEAQGRYTQATMSHTGNRSACLQNSPSLQEQWEQCNKLRLAHHPQLIHIIQPPLHYPKLFLLMFGLHAHQGTCSLPHHSPKPSCLPADGSSLPQPNDKFAHHSTPDVYRHTQLPQTQVAILPGCQRRALGGGVLRSMFWRAGVRSRK